MEYIDIDPAWQHQEPIERHIHKRSDEIISNVIGCDNNALGPQNRYFNLLPYGIVVRRKMARFDSRAVKKKDVRLVVTSSDIGRSDGADIGMVADHQVDVGYHRFQCAFVGGQVCQGLFVAHGRYGLLVLVR